MNYSKNGQHKSGDYNYLQRIAIDYMSSNEDSENDQIDDNGVKGDVGDGFIIDSENEQINNHMVACRRRKRTHFSASKTRTENKKRRMNSIWDFPHLRKLLIKMYKTRKERLDQHVYQQLCFILKQH